MTTIDMNRHKDAFLAEARAHVAQMNASLLKVEKSPLETNELFEVLRAAHTIKGMAGTMGYARTSDLCHALEDVVLAIRNDSISICTCADLLFESFDSINATLDTLANGGTESDSIGLITRLRNLFSTAAVPLKHVSVSQDYSGASASEPIRTVAVSVEKLDILLNLAEELLVGRMRLGRLKETLNNLELTATVESVGRLIEDLQYNVMQARMVPIGFVFDRFPRMVRDLAKSQGKEVDLVLEGGDIELDRAMIDEISECLVHLLRNAVDHGVESIETRSLAGKSLPSVLRLTASRDKQSALISVEDDGAGLDRDAIQLAGIQSGALQNGCAPEQVIESIFRGVSTTTQVNSVSGRGMGLNIVKRKADAIGGTIRVESNVGRGTKFTITIPLTMAVIKTLFVGIGGRTYAIPVTNIERLVSARAADVKKALGEEAIVLDNEKVPVRRLDKLFHYPSSNLRQQPIVIVQKGMTRLGLAVDSLMSTEEIVIKPLSSSLRDNRFFAGSALIGSGEVVMVLDVGHLV